MEFYSYLKSNRSSRTAARFLIIFLLLVAVLPGLTQHVDLKVQSAKVSLSQHNTSFDFTVCPIQPKVDFNRYESKSVYDSAFLKTKASNFTLISLQNYKAANIAPRISGCLLTLLNFPHKAPGSSYVFVDIPPPFLNI